jgi:hypothetical protein
MKDLDDFAVAVIQGMLAGPGRLINTHENETWQRAIARVSFEIADAMQAESKKRRERESEEGWIEWGGGACPVPARSRVAVRLRSGATHDAVFAEDMFWSHTGGRGDIVAYRVIL